MLEWFGWLLLACCYICSDMLENSCGVVSLQLVLLVMMHLVLCFLRLSMSVAIPQVQFLDQVLCLVVASGAWPDSADHVPVPQMVDQLLSFLTALDSFVPEQVIEVPKISTPSRCPRTVHSVPQTAEHLVEVPTIISYSREVRISERIVEQTVFPSREERISERIVEQTVFPSRDERISERTVEQFVDIPVHGRGASSRGGPQDSVPAVPGQSSTAFGGGLQDFLPEQVSTAFYGAELAHVLPRHGALHGSRRGGGPVEGLQGSVPGQSSRRRFTGRIWHMPAAGLSGFIESHSARAAYAFVGDVPFFLEGSCRLGDHVTFAVGRGADGLEASDLEVVGRE